MKQTAVSGYRTESSHNSVVVAVAVAEAAPIVRAGLNACLRRLPGLGDVDVVPIDVTSYKELVDVVSADGLSSRLPAPCVVIANPAFTPQFTPETLRADTHRDSLPVVALSTGMYSPTALRAYDAVISVVDETDTLASTLRPFLLPGNSEPQTDREPLSTREKEIVVLVVKGLTNKEIADKLFLSVHTVITHRRNIARKLEIHSATGLTIYAIVNKLVDLSDIHL